MAKITISTHAKDGPADLVAARADTVVLGPASAAPAVRMATVKKDRKI